MALAIVSVRRRVTGRGVLGVANARRFLGGELVSMVGNAVGTFADLWLLVTLAGDFWTTVGAALFTVPLLLGGLWTGIVADAVSRRRVRVATNILLLLNESVLVLTVAAGVVAPWMILVSVGLRGVINAFDQPAREAFLYDVAGPERMAGAVSLKMSATYLANLVGPLLAAVVIAHWGIAGALAVNALSFAAPLAALVSIRGVQQTALARGRWTEVLGQFRTRPELWSLVIAGSLSIGPLLVLPALLASESGGGTGAFAALGFAVGIGSVAGSLLARVLRSHGTRTAAGFVAALGIAELLAALASGPLWPAVLLGAAGALSAAFVTVMQTHLSKTAPAVMQGRMMALYGMARIGPTALGAPLVGWLSGAWSPHVALVAGGLAALVAAVVALRARDRRPS